MYSRIESARSIAARGDFAAWVAASVAASVVVSGLLGAVPPAQADLFVGPSAPLDPSKNLTVRDQTGVVSSLGNSDVTLFVWNDLRTGNADVFAARVAADGTVLDPDGIEIAGGDRVQGEPAVSFGGTSWLVTWSEEVTPGNRNVFALRVAADGSLPDGAPIAVAATSSDEHDPAVSWDGSRYLLVWVDDAGPTARRIAGTTLQSNGTVNGAAAFVSQATSDTDPAIAVSGGVGLLAFTSLRDGNGNVYSIRLQGASSGTLLTRLSPADINLTAGNTAKQERPAVASSGSGWLVAWEDARNQGSAGLDVFGTRVNAGGAAQDAAGLELAGETGDDTAPSLFFEGPGWLLTWSQVGIAQYLRRIAANGTVSPERLEVSTTVGLAGVGTIGGPTASPLVAWSEATTGGDQDVLAREYFAEGDPDFGDPFALTMQTPNQTQPSLAFGSSRWLAAWVDDRFGPTQGQIRIGLTSGDEFETLVPGTIQFAAGRPGLDQANPVTLFDGTNFQIFWSEERGGHRRIVGATYAPSGAFVDSFTVSSGAWDETEPTAAANPDDESIVILWTDNRNGVTERDVFGVEWWNGSPVGTEQGLLTNANLLETQAHISRGPNFTGWMVVFQSSAGPGQSSIKAAFLFLPLTSTLFPFPVAEEAGRRFETPNIGFSGQDWLFTFQEIVDSDGQTLFIPMARWYQNFFGLNFQTHQLGPGSYVPANPATCGAGYDFVTAWGRLEAGNSDVLVRAFNPVQSGGPYDPTLAASTDPAQDGGPALASGPADRYGFAFLRAQQDGDWNGLRLFGGAGQDTLAGRVVINEFLANPPSDFAEFYELANVSNRRIQLNGWEIAVNGTRQDVTICNDRIPPPDGESPGGSGPLGNQCGEIPTGEYRAEFNFFNFPTIPGQGKLPNRHGKLQLFSPTGVLVDQVAYGDSGAAPVSGGIPVGDVPAGGIFLPRAGTGDARTFAPGDSAAISTSRIPDGVDSGDDGADFNLTPNNTPGAANVGTEAALGTQIFFTRVYASGVNDDAVEFYNARPDQAIDFNQWYLSDGENTQRINLPGSAFTHLEPFEKRILRRGEPGSFNFSLDYDDVLYLYDASLSRVEQIAWWRNDLAFPADSCMTRTPETAGSHSGHDWVTSGGDFANYTQGPVRYQPCSINSPNVGGVPPVSGVVQFQGAIPNPATVRNGAVIAFTLPGKAGDAPGYARLQLFDVAGRRVATLAEGAFEPGEHRIPLSAHSRQGKVLPAGVYHARLEVGGRIMSRPVVFLP